MRVIGLMSGTSFDAIDAAAADLWIEDQAHGRGSTIVLSPRGVLSRPYTRDLRAALAAVLPPGATTVAQVCQLHAVIGQAFAALAAEANEQLCDSAADLVVSSGQTVFHWVEDGRAQGSLQLGEPAWIAEHTGVPVVADLRSRDIAAGGQGAPLVSYFDLLWLSSRPGRPVALNLGGIANITVVGGGQEAIAFDTGPANALIDVGARHATGGRLDYDVDGALAARGRVDEELLQRLLAEPYYSLPAPKSTGKELFHLPYLLRAMEGLTPRPPEDIVATLTALTALTVADAVTDLGGTEVIAAGGGTRNPVLMRMLATQLGDTPLLTTTELGLPASAKEAYAFAALGFLSAQGLVGTDPGCTGARHASILGSFTPGRRPLDLRSPAVGNPARLRVNPMSLTTATPGL